MKLHLLRKQNSRRGKGMLFCKDRPWAKILENPRGRPRVPDGIYLLDWAYTEAQGWHIEIIGKGGERFGRILPLRAGREVPGDVLSPVVSFKRTTYYSRLAFLRLIERLPSQREEDWYLEIETTPHVVKRLCG